SDSKYADNSGIEAHNAARRRKWESRVEQNLEHSQRLSRISSMFANESFLRDRQQTLNLIDEMPEDEREVFHDALRYVLDTLVFELHATVTQTKLTFLDTRTIESPEFLAYQTAKRQYDRMVAASGFSIENLMQESGTGK